MVVKDACIEQFVFPFLLSALNSPRAPSPTAARIDMYPSGSSPAPVEYLLVIGLVLLSCYSSQDDRVLGVTADKTKSS